ncbi:hypothetical protein [Methylocapsa acidiphila]|uniref:hypothetical protein n=1 Tax=Methylocapsa acidiphila TaxID=133552 RepID=UPI0003FC3D13|nr:hypothetical protein [Methylocapsa acidiphila]
MPNVTVPANGRSSHAIRVGARHFGLLSDRLAALQAPARKPGEGLDFDPRERDELTALRAIAAAARG